MQVKVTVKIHSNINQLALIEGNTIPEKLQTMFVRLKDEYEEVAKVYADSAYITFIGGPAVAMFAAEHFV